MDSTAGISRAVDVDKIMARDTPFSLREAVYSVTDVIDNAMSKLVDPLLDKYDERDRAVAMMNPDYVEIEERMQMRRDEGANTQPFHDVMDSLDILRSVRKNTRVRGLLESFTRRPTTSATRAVDRTLQRARRGWSNEDVWSLDSSFTRVLGEQLAFLAENSNGWPATEEYPNPEDWEKSLRDASNKLLVYSGRWELWEGDEEDTDSILAKEELILKDAQEALAWVTINLPALWD